MSYSEFLILSEYYRTKHERPDLEHYYLAQIAREIRVVLYKAADAKKFKINDFLITFEEKAPPIKEKTKAVSPEEEIEIKTKTSQSFWFALTGFKNSKVKEGIQKKAAKDGKANSTRRTGGRSNRQR